MPTELDLHPELFHASMNALHNGIALLNAEGRIIFWNDWMIRMSGRPGGDTIGKTMDQVFPEQAGSNLMNAVRWALKNGLPSLLTPVLNRRPLPLASKGRRIEQSIVVTPLADVQNQRCCLISISDVTTLTEKECLLRTRAQRLGEELETFFDLIPELVCVASPDGRFLRINRMWEEVLGYTAQEILATSFLDFIHPDDRDATMREVERQLAGNATMHFTNRYRRKDGSYRWLEWGAAPSVDGKLLLAAARDITKQKELAAELERYRCHLEELIEERTRKLAGLVETLETRELALEQQQRFLKTITDALPGAVSYWSGELCCGFANSTCLNWFGKRPEEVIGIHIRDMLGEAPFRKNEPYIRAALRGEPQFFERTLVKADGSTSYALANYIPDVVDGQTRGFFVLVTDVTSLKEAQFKLEQANAELSSSEQKFRAIAESGPFAVVVTDAMQNTLYVNPVFEQMFGYTIEDVPTVEAWCSLAYPSEQARNEVLQRWNSTVEEAICSHSKIPPQERLVTCKNGSTLPMEFRMASAGDTNVIIIIDTTARKQAENAYKALAVTFAGLTGKPFFEAISRHLAEVLGVDYVFVGRLTRDGSGVNVLGGYARGAIMEEMTYALAGTPCEQIVGKKFYAYPKNVQAQFPEDLLLGQLGAESYAATPIFDKRRNPVGILAVLHSRPMGELQNAAEFFDVFSERVAAEMQRSNAEEMLIQLNVELEDRIKERTAALAAAKEATGAAEKANRAKSTFLANMSHELRTPLNAIIGFSELLGHDSKVSEKQKEILAIVHRSGDHLLDLINSVLDIAKIESGHVVLENEPFDFSAMIRDITGMLRVRTLEKGLRLTVNESPQFPQHIVGDETKLRQILINLISNAINATEQGGITLHLGLKHNHAERLIIEVEDTGCGIAPEDQAKLMQPFVRVDRRKQQGTGLGLAIARQFIELMGGHLSMNSNIGQGSTFRIDLPVQLARPEDIQQAHEARGKVIGLKPGQPAYRILVVEDHPDGYALMGCLLENVGFHVRLVMNGAEAVEQFQNWHPHFIWMDRRMPVMDGVEATRRIRALPDGEAVKIVAVTASTLEDKGQELMACGFNAVVHKPFRFEEIFGCMERLLGLCFERAEAEPPAHTPLLELLAMAALPELLRQNLLQALVILDNDCIMSVIDAIAQIDPELGAALKRHAQDYDYAPILALLQSGGGAGGWDAAGGEGEDRTQRGAK